MIVYGDPQVSWNARAFREHLVFASQRPSHSTETLRALLIQAGQFEQALFDCGQQSQSFPKHILDAAALATDLAARTFCATWLKQNNAASRSLPRDDPLEKMAEILNDLELPHDLSITAKTPEGFEFYSLFPEQYCAAALHWARDQESLSRKTVLIVGIRSIGTSLSALVAATLDALGWATQRFTVRPTGHPFSRHIEIPPFEISRFKAALVVDEGPGLSGSSMAATTQMLATLGISNISFLPSHADGPGPDASIEIRSCWSTTPQYVTPLAELQWHGSSLTELFARESQNLSGSAERFAVTDLSAGNWRRYAFKSEAEWPPVAAQFERSKFLCTDPKGRSVLWKFAGFGSTQKSESNDNTFRKLSALAEKGFTARPLGTLHGFIALPWTIGHRLTRADASPAFLQRLGSYLIHSANPENSADARKTSVSRLADMLYWNCKEALGDAAADETRRWVSAAECTGVPLAYGDGHLAPHEWIRTGTGAILKTDCEGHDADHTMVGRQSLLWDVAGAMIEWDLNSSNAAPLLAPIQTAGVEFTKEQLAFYQMAYAAFRMGLMALARSQTSDSREQHRLESAFAYYKQKLAIGLESRAFNCETVPLPTAH